MRVEGHQPQQARIVKCFDNSNVCSCETAAAGPPHPNTAALQPFELISRRCGIWLRAPDNRQVISMKKIIIILALVVVAFSSFEFAQAQNSSGGGRYEYAIVKWDGPDRLYYNLPDKFELVYLGRLGVNIPKDAQPEEFCLAYATNKMAKEGWEPVNLDSRRIVFRRLAR